MSFRPLTPVIFFAILAVAACSGTIEETSPSDSSTDGATDLGSFDTDDDSGSRWDTEDDADAEPAPDAETEVAECSVGEDCEDDNPCTEYSCVDRVCVRSTPDTDGDGSPDGACGGTDCDDDNEEISAGSERLCTNDCGVGGIERCVAAEWTACSAPPDCDCTLGEERAEDCAMCGTAIRECEDDGTWGELGSCTRSGECEPEDITLENCDGLVCDDSTLYGVRALTCTASCAWSAAECLDSPTCCPSTTSDQSCGSCGSATRTCDEGGSWGEYGACDEPECCTGETDVGSCGECGLQTRSCEDTSWGLWGGCTEPVCCPGDTDTAECGVCGSQTLGCVEGAWSRIDICDEPECCAGETDVGECGDCGTQTRDCDGETWGEWGLCLEPICCEDDTSSSTCNECGQQTRSCSDGSWGEYGACIGTGGPARDCDSGFLCNDDGFCYCADPPCEVP